MHILEFDNGLYNFINLTVMNKVFTRSRHLSYIIIEHSDNSILKVKPQ